MERQTKKRVEEIRQRQLAIRTKISGLRQVGREYFKRRDRLNEQIRFYLNKRRALDAEYREFKSGRIEQLEARVQELEEDIGRVVVQPKAERLRALRAKLAAELGVSEEQVKDALDREISARIGS